MRFFFCAFKGFYLAIPIRFVSSLMLYPFAAARAVEYREENGNTYFSLPHLFGLPEEAVRHGIVLKDPDGREDETGQAVENRNILLTTEVEREIDIPGNELYPLPETLAGMGAARMFGGIRFVSTGDGADTLVLALDPEYLVTRNKGGSSLEPQPAERRFPS
ncbi:MAG: hypothetical protein LBD48_02390 [Treponema sp.]|jgi:hypothetical protein|nr:hypothetical protein [Treponema sp.]